jgi:hypothetical protein
MGGRPNALAKATTFSAFGLFLPLCHRDTPVWSMPVSSATLF